MKLPSFFKNKKPKTSWKWPQFMHHKTLPFEAKDKKLKNIKNSVLSEATKQLATTLDSSWSTKSESCRGGESLEMPYETFRSERLFFEPGNTSRSIFAAAGFPLNECVVIAMESEDPYVDFRTSMEEMVEAYGWLNSYGEKDFECLEELLAWYLRMNRKKNHSFIIGAFLDMFFGLSSSSSNSFSCDAASASSAMCKGGREGG